MSRRLLPVVALATQAAAVLAFSGNPMAQVAQSAPPRVVVIMPGLPPGLGENQRLRVAPPDPSPPVVMAPADPRSLAAPTVAPPSLPVTAIAPPAPSVTADLPPRPPPPVIARRAPSETDIAPSASRTKVGPSDA